jgi:hypothetical protein
VGRASAAGDGGASLERERGKSRWSTLIAFQIDATRWGTHQRRAHSQILLRKDGPTRASVNVLVPCF